MSTNNPHKFVRIALNWFNLNQYGNLSLKSKKRKFALLVIFNILLSSPWGLAQKNYAEFVSPAIKTVQFHRENWPLSHPIIRLNAGQSLNLSFDEPGSGTKNYHYTVMLCDINWNEADLMVTEYIRGIPVNPLNDYAFSFNTTFDYVRYQLTLPNENLQLTRSGNYVLMVFENHDRQNPVIVKHFLVVEQHADIVPRIKKTAQSSIRASHQEINFEVNHAGFTINNPIEEISAVIRQNGRTDNVISNLKPIFFRDGFMDFNYNRETMMEGGNEFRYADIRSTRFLSDRIQSVEFMDPFYHITLFPDAPRNPSSYYYRQDLNGRYYIQVQERNNPELEADYMFVHFKLQVERPNPLQKIYLNGALTNWQLNESSQMVYNPMSKAYEISLLLKQGYYNYQYLTVEAGETSGSLFPIENSFHQTENDYLIILYYKGISDRNHRIIGAETFNTLLPAPRMTP